MFGETLKNKRQALGLSKVDVASKIGIHAGSLCNIEANKTNASIEVVEKLAKLLDLDLLQLIRLRDDFESKTNQKDVDIGLQIKRYRNMANLTQLDLAKQLGYSSSGTVSLVEKGRRGMGRNKLLECCKIFNIHIADLMAPPSVNSVDEEKFYRNFIKIFSAKEKPATYQAIVDIVNAAAESI